MDGAIHRSMVSVIITSPSAKITAARTVIQDTRLKRNAEVSEIPDFLSQNQAGITKEIVPASKPVLSIISGMTLSDMPVRMSIPVIEKIVATRNPSDTPTISKTEANPVFTCGWLSPDIVIDAGSIPIPFPEILSIFYLAET